MLALSQFSPTNFSRPLCHQTTSSVSLSHGSLGKSQPIQMHKTKREASKCAGYCRNAITHYHL